ncbi:MAG: hypothetical protein ACRDYZ_10720 [Acidimicrobiales bacterium]
MPDLPELAWTDGASGADWLGPRLADTGKNEISTIVPSGFPAYARVLHPAQEEGPRGGPVRWRDVAAWSAMPLGPASQFHSVALPPAPPPPGRPPPWSGQGPRAGSLFSPDAATLSRVLRAHTTAPEDCWFCLWAGYCWQGVPLTSEGSPPALPLPDPIPEAVRSGPQVVLPHRQYFVYRGPVEHALIGLPGGRCDQTANLWWPADRTWCVATEIDLAWTYVGGSAGLVAQLVAEPDLEAQATDPGDPVAGVEPWVEDWAAVAIEALLASGRATVVTPLGTVEAWLEQPGRWRRGCLRTRQMPSYASWRGGGGHALSAGRGEATLCRALSSYLTRDIVGLVGGC